MNAIAIGNTNVAIKEYKGQRVVTFKDIDTVHGRPDGTARRNFNRNKEHFIEGEDFFVRNSYEAKKEYSATAPNGLTLLTESGYLMLAKSFTDKVAWDVQRALVKAYFRVKQEQSPICLSANQTPYQQIKDFLRQNMEKCNSSEMGFIVGMVEENYTFRFHKAPVNHLTPVDEIRQIIRKRGNDFTKDDMLKLSAYFEEWASSIDKNEARGVIDETMLWKMSEIKRYSMALNSVIDGAKVILENTMKLSL